MASEEFKILWKVYLAELIRGVGALIIPFFVIFFQQKGLTLVEFGVLLSVVSITNLFLEIPTGVIADRFGRKFSTILGFLIWYISFFLMIFTNSYPLLFLLFIMYGVGFTLQTGAYEAWIYEHLKTKKQEHLMHHFFTRKIIISNIGLIIAGLIGGYLASFLELKWLLIFDTILGVFFLFLMSTVSDPPIAKVKGNYSFAYMWQTAKEGLHLVMKTRLLLLLTIASLGFMVFIGAHELLTQPAFIELGMPLHYLGYFFAISSLCIVIGSVLLFPLAKKHPNKILIFLSVVMFLCFIAMFFVNTYIGFAILILLVISLNSIISPLHESIFQHASKSEVRATAMSVVNMLRSVVFIFTYIIFGWLAGIYSSKITFALVAIFFIPVIICYILLRKN